MAKKRQSKAQKASYRYKNRAKTIFRQPLAGLTAVVLVILLGAWLAGGFSSSSDNLSTEPSSLKGVQTVSQSPVTTAPPPPPALLWQGTARPVVIPPNTIPVLYKIPTDQPVVFLGIDDGWTKSQEAQDWMVLHRLPFSLFLTNDAIKSNYGYFQKLQSAGPVVENHTLHHLRLTRLSLARQEAEICTAADTYEMVFGRRPTLFRPPYGVMNNLTVQAAQACGMRAIIMWHASVENGAVQFQDGSHLLPGDIVLMHFHSNLTTDLQAFFNQAQADHLQVARLESWLP